LHQIERDGKITDLVQDIQDLYAFLKATDPSKYDERQKKIVTSLAQQTIECAYFIRQYASDPNFCESYFIMLL
jgi:major membrane immunogen (membrane-anchored lipoprotein)